MPPPGDTNHWKILSLGSGPIPIGHAAEALIMKQGLPRVICPACTFGCWLRDHGRTRVVLRRVNQTTQSNKTWHEKTCLKT
ncbi:MAG: hypothetical protein KAS74_00320 [Methanosarcinales archaeon]|nr:hypothetical protein [Methanosarcinales archaeon]